ncbi:MAG: T9SS type A sorting domain-containing protein, partial [Bacteroidales bacterium]|nr:T9SS type A sorting domain-containing protein [Bacteroidales bacterium]
SEGSGDVSGIIGQNLLSEFTFDYIGINMFMNELNPESSIAIWQNSQNEDICGVFYEDFGSGKAIGVTTPFGSLKSDTHTKKELMEAYLQLFDIVISGTPENTNIKSQYETSFHIYPNPMNINLTVEFSLQQSSFINITLYDVYGKEVGKLVSGNFVVGKHEIEWNAEGLQIGIYFLRLETNGISETKKIILLK